MNTDNSYSNGFNDDKTVSFFSKVSPYAKQNIKETAYLIIIDSERIIKTVELNKNEMTIGKHGDIVLHSSIVSRIHGKFTEYMGEYYYNDEGSLNGTELNGTQIRIEKNVPSKKYNLGNGDVIKIFVPDNPSHPENVLIIFSTGSVSNSKWSYINLYNKASPFFIGRSVNADGLRIESVQASKIHAIIYRASNGFYIADQNSLNGVAVNGKRIFENRLLSDYDVICIANKKIIYLSGYIIFNTSPNGVRLEINNISKTVNSNKHTILDNISLTINPCELVAVIGGSGAGKTTFLNCINGYEPATSGTVCMDGLNLYDNYSLLKSRIGNVPQSDDLYDYLSVYNFLKFTAMLRLPKDISKKERQNRINDVLEIMGLEEHKNKLIKKLSGGQKKRVSIAMEMVSDPDIFFLDEPTSGLDPETETSLMKQLKKLSSEIGKTIIVITHTLQNIHLFDKIVFLAPGGRLCYYGTPVSALEFFNVTTISDAYEKVRNNTDYFVEKCKKYQ